MTWPLALVLIVALCVLAHGIREWRRIRVADALAEQAKANTTALISRDMRAAGERLERHLSRFEAAVGLHKSDNLAPVSEDRLSLIKSDVVIPFGKKPATEQPTDGGAA